VEARVQTLQWCPSAWDVVTLEIEGWVFGKMVNGVVKECCTCNKQKCEAKRNMFCWICKQILTALSS